MSKKVVTAKPNQLLRDVISLMDKHGFKEIPIVDSDNKVKGIVSYFEVLNLLRFRGDSKISNFMIPTHVIKEGESEESVLDLMINCGLTGFPIVNKNKKITGFVSDHDLLKFYINDSSLKGLSVGDAHVKSVKPVTENSSIGEVKVIMQFNKRDRLPVVDEKGKFIGTIILLDLLRTFYADAPTKIGKKFFIKGDLSKIMNVSIEGLVRPDVKVGIDSGLVEAVNLMLENNLLGIIVVNREDEPIGVLDRCSVLKKINSLITESGITVNISGEVPRSIIGEVKNVISNNFKLLPRYSKSVNSLKLFVKRIHDSNSDGKVEVHLRVFKDGDDIIIKKVGYDLLFTLVECVDKANQLLKQEMESY